jgi:23S rRNA (cytidine1920-2'-O)/16S rRNA (cytidine1409-2'-O)-methyltransferase
MATTQRRKLAREVARRWPELGDSAADLIAAGAVLVDGIPRTNPEMLVAASDSVRIDDQRRPLRGRVKLQAALDAFPVPVEGRVALDAGAAAGGFTQALLENGAAKVYAVEAGFGQLLGSLAQDARVVNLERTNLGALTPELVPDAVGLVTLDTGYLSLAKAVPQLDAVELAAGAELLGLVKPVNELGLAELPAGVDAVEEATERAAEAIAAAGWSVRGSMRSPVTGSRGALEGWVHAVRAGSGGG